MQSCFELLRTLAGSGFSLSFTGGLLKAVPKSRLPDELRADIRLHKQEIIGALLKDYRDIRFLLKETCFRSSSSSLSSSYPSCR